MKKIIARILPLILAISLLVVFVQPSSAAPTAGTEMTATEDTYIYRSFPNNTYDLFALTLEYQPNPGPGNVRVVLLKFGNITMANPIVEARLNLFATNCGGFLPFNSEQVDVYAVTNDGWSEGTVTWDNFNVPENTNRGTFLLSIDALPTVEDYNHWTDLNDATNPLADFLQAQNLANSGDGTASLWLEISGATGNTLLSFMDKDDASGNCGAAGGNHPVLQFADATGPLAVTISNLNASSAPSPLLWAAIGFTLIISSAALFYLRRRSRSTENNL